jgi:hypothetical protein
MNVFDTNRPQTIVRIRRNKVLSSESPESYPTSDFLIHFGTKGMKWGVRRFQEDDGSYTPAGRERYGIGLSKNKGNNKEYRKESKEMNTLMRLSKKGFDNTKRELAEKLAKSDKIKNLGNDKDLNEKSKKTLDSHNKVYELSDKKNMIERKYEVYGDDLDGWDPKTGKKYGINEKQYNEIIKARDEYEKAKSAYEDASRDYYSARRAKAESFVKKYMSQPYSKIKNKKDNAEKYTTYIDHLLGIDQENRMNKRQGNK